jgi:Uma2 family endonuclease
MSTATARRGRSATLVRFGLESNGILLTPREFDEADAAEFDECWDYELINGVLIVSPIPLDNEVDPNEELGRWLRNYQESHPLGSALDATLPERYVRTGLNLQNRRKADRVIWAGLGRLPRPYETPTIVVEFVSAGRRNWLRDYIDKRDEYLAIGVREYWVFDPFQYTLTVFRLQGGKVRTRTFSKGQTYKTKLLPGFELPLARLFTVANRWPAED